MKDRKTEIADNLAKVKEEIRLACMEAGRDPQEVKLVAISKNFPVEDIKHAEAAGQENFGENRVQELTPKIEAMTEYENIKWHLVGTLQRNKVKFVAGKVSMIHSVDSIRLVRRIDHVCRENDCVTDVLLQVNISGEETKSGFETDELDEVLRVATNECPAVKIHGLRTIAPWYDNPDDTLPVFAEAQRLLKFYKEKYNLEHFDQLSMGMSHDYKQAIACGSTMVRIGTAIFGERDYSL